MIPIDIECAFAFTLIWDPFLVFVLFSNDSDKQENERREKREMRTEMSQICVVNVTWKYVGNIPVTLWRSNILQAEKKVSSRGNSLQNHCWESAICSYPLSWRSKWSFFPWSTNQRSMLVSIQSIDTRRWIKSSMCSLLIECNDSMKSFRKRKMSGTENWSLFRTIWAVSRDEMFVCRFLNVDCFFIVRGFRYRWGHRLSLLIHWFCRSRRIDILQGIVCWWTRFSFGNHSSLSVIRIDMRCNETQCDKTGNNNAEDLRPAQRIRIVAVGVGKTRRWTKKRERYEDTVVSVHSSNIESERK